MHPKKLDPFITAAVAVFVLLSMARRCLLDLSAALGRCYAATIAPAVLIAPAACHPAAMIAGELSSLSCAQLRVLTGCRRHLPKAQLIALAIAA